MDTKYAITPECCEQIKKSFAVCLHSPYAFDYSRDYKNPPTWMIKGYEIYKGTYALDATVEVAFCPHCGKKLPEIEPRLTSEKICEPDESGDYCLTCKQRLGECECYPPSYAWQPKK